MDNFLWKIWSPSTSPKKFLNFPLKIYDLFFFFSVIHHKFLVLCFEFRFLAKHWETANNFDFLPSSQNNIFRQEIRGSRCLKIYIFTFFLTEICSFQKSGAPNDVSDWRWLNCISNNRCFILKRIHDCRLCTDLTISELQQRRKGQPLNLYALS